MKPSYELTNGMGILNYGLLIALKNFTNDLLYMNECGAILGIFLN